MKFIFKNFSIIIFALILSGCLEDKTSEEAVKKNKHKSDSKDSVRSHFVSELLMQTIQPLPFEFESYLLRSLSNRSEYMNAIYLIKYAEPNKNIPTLNNLYKELNLKISVNSINDDTKSFLPEYYGFLINYGGQSSFSNSSFYKRLPNVNKGIEVFIAVTKIKSPESENYTGIVFNLVTFNVTKNKIIDNKRILTAGIGLEDISYYEGFTILKNFEIRIKSYQTMEDGRTELSRKLIVNPNGKIKVLENKVINND